jgi:hypothetical protein
MNTYLILTEMYVKLKLTAFYGFIASPFIWILEKITGWYIENQYYVLFVLGAIIVDHILGSIYHKFYKKDFAIKQNLIGLIVKVGLAVMVGFLFEGVNILITADDKFAELISGWTVMTLRLIVFLYPTMSALENSSAMTGGKFPPTGIFKKLKSFSETADLDDLKQNKN